MAEAATIARPYAKAAFMAARDSKSLADWGRATAVAAALAAEPKVAAMFADPKLRIDDLVGVFAGLGGDAVDGQWRNFVRLLAENKRLDVLPQIAAQYDALRLEHENELDVHVTTAAVLDETQRAKLAASLKTRFKRNVRLSTAVDPALIGGAVIQAGDLVIDGSLKGRLERLATELSS